MWERLEQGFFPMQTNVTTYNLREHGRQYRRRERN